MFEKYDGIRAFWNPEKKAFLSRFGKTFNIPTEFISSMPTIFLDGELWYGSSCYLPLAADPFFTNALQVRRGFIPGSHEIVA